MTKLMKITNIIAIALILLLLIDAFIVDGLVFDERPTFFLFCKYALVAMLVIRVINSSHRNRIRG